MTARMAMVTGSVRRLTLWPVKSMGGELDVDGAVAVPGGLLGDRGYALVDRRPLRDGKILSARNLPGILRWAAAAARDGQGPEVTAPDGRSWRWNAPGLVEALSDDLGARVDLAGPGSYADLDDSVLVTTAATHEAVEREFGQALDARRWRANVHLDLSAPGHAERGWEGRTLVVGDPDDGGVELRLLHPCKRCAIPTWEPGGGARLPELLSWFHSRAGGVFGINARVVRPGALGVGAPVVVR